jgi:hypothetical protein
MPEKAVYLLVVEGFADWEPAHAVAELRRHGHYRVESVGLTSAAVRSREGLPFCPQEPFQKSTPRASALHSTTLGEIRRDILQQ